MNCTQYANRSRQDFPGAENIAGSCCLKMHQISSFLVQSNNKYIQGTLGEWMVKSKQSYHSGPVALRQ